MSMVIQNNLNALNARNHLARNVLGTARASERLSSGFRINRAGDDAAGLAVSESMRSQLRGLSQAIRNANDGISVIQTAEGALDETHAMLGRLRELAVQQANGIYSDRDRQNVQIEVDALITEINRISTETDFNGTVLLDGSLSGLGGVGPAGPAFAYIRTTQDAWAGTVITASNAGISVSIATTAGGAHATWDEAGTTLTINLRQGEVYTQAQIDSLVENATRSEVNQNNIPELQVRLSTPSVMMQGAVNFGPTQAGVRASATGSLTPFFHQTPGFGNTGSADRITITSNNFGENLRTFQIATNTNTEGVTVTGGSGNPNVRDGVVTINLVAGRDYTGEQISQLLAEAGLDYTVEFSSSINPDAQSVFRASATTAATHVVSLSTGTPARTIPGHDGGAQVTILGQTGEFVGVEVGNLNTALTTASNWTVSSNWDGIAADATTVTMSWSFTYNGVTINGTRDTTAMAADANGAIHTAANTVDAAAWIASTAGAGLGTAPSASALPPAAATDVPATGLTPADVADLGNALSLFQTAVNDFRTAVTAATIGAEIDAAVIALNAAIGWTTDPATGAHTQIAYVGDASTSTAAGANINDALQLFNQLAGTNFQAIAALPTGENLDTDTALARADALDTLIANTLSMASAGRNGAGVGGDRVVEGGRGMTFQIGARHAAGQRVTLNVGDMGARALGVDTFSVLTQEAAQNSIAKAEEATHRVSAQRAGLGALQNRLESTINNLTNVHENLTAAESAIRDADMAAEMINFTRFNILQQAAQAMLAQANQAPQAILQLLR